MTLEPAAGRTAYYLVRLVGPAAPEWLQALQVRGAQVHSSLAGFTLLVGMLPERVDEVRAEPWVEDVTPYRPAMKVSPKLRAGAGRDLDADTLAAVAVDELDDQTQLVEVSVFPGESVSEVAARIRQAGATLKGTGQIIGIADSGLDSGDPARMHANVRGRVVDVVSWPVDPTVTPFTNDPPGSDDGPADEHSGHGTHVTGSVLGNGATALAGARIHTNSWGAPAKGVTPRTRGRWTRACAAA